MKTVTLYNLKIVKEANISYGNLPKQITQPRDAYDVCKYALEMDLLTEEYLFMITVDTKNNVTGIFKVSQGSINASIVHPREIFKRACMINASSIIIAHNHPSGNPTPSEEDKSITSRIAECGKLIGIDLLDHIIVGDNKFVSMKEEGIL